MYFAQKEFLISETALPSLYMYVERHVSNKTGDKVYLITNEEEIIF